MSAAEEPGRYGGRTLRRIESAGVMIPAGTVLKPETVLGWPIRNRLALQNTRKVEYFNAPPADGDVSDIFEPAAKPRRSGAGGKS